MTRHKIVITYFFTQTLTFKKMMRGDTTYVTVESYMYSKIGWKIYKFIIFDIIIIN